MVGYVDLFRSRMRLDPKLQPSWNSALRALNDWTVGYSPFHPYDRRFSSKCTIAQLNEICMGGNISLPAGRYVYRVSNINAVIRPNNSENPFNTNVPEQNWNLLTDDMSSQTEWLQLSKYISGPVPGRRHFTWWTPLDLLMAPVLPNAHRIGIINNWLDRFILVLRLDLSMLNLRDWARIPTVIDGFDAPIFLASQRDAAIGTAIDLREPDALRPGASELVIRDLPCEFVQILPFLIGPDQKAAYPIDEEAILEPLLCYYNEREALL